MDGGIDFDFKINGKRVPANNETELKAVRDYLTNFLHWLENKPDPITLVTANLTIVGHTPTVTVGETPPKTQRKSRAKVGERTIDYVVRALGFAEKYKRTLPGGTRKRDAYEFALQLGWVSSSKDPKNALRTFEIMARQNRELVTITKGLMNLTTEGREHLKMLEQLDASTSAQEELAKQSTVNAPVRAFGSD